MTRGMNHSETDTGQAVFGNFQTGAHVHDAPMQGYNGGLRRKLDRQAPESDVDILPHQLRNFVNASGAQDVQLNNGLHHGIAAGLRIPYRGAGWLALAAPFIPGQTRGDVAGFHTRGPSPLNYQQMWQQGPGSQPDNPGGPGRIAGTALINPMTG